MSRVLNARESSLVRLAVLVDLDNSRHPSLVVRLVHVRSRYGESHAERVVCPLGRVGARVGRDGGSARNRGEVYVVSARVFVDEHDRGARYYRDCVRHEVIRVARITCSIGYGDIERRS